MGFRVGVIPLPVLLVLVAVTGDFVRVDRMPTEICMTMAVIAVGGFLFAEVGKRLPLVRNIGGAAIFAAFVPSALVYHGVLPTDIVKPVTDFTKSTSFLYLFVGTGVGMLLGLGARHSLLFVVIPIMAGGIGEGANPLFTGSLKPPRRHSRKRSSPSPSGRLRSSTMISWLLSQSASQRLAARLHQRRGVGVLSQPFLEKLTKPALVFDDQDLHGAGGACARAHGETDGEIEIRAPWPSEGKLGEENFSFASCVIQFQCTQCTGVKRA